MTFGFFFLTLQGKNNTPNHALNIRFSLPKNIYLKDKNCAFLTRPRSIIRNPNMLKVWLRHARQPHSTIREMETISKILQ